MMPWAHNKTFLQKAIMGLPKEGDPVLAILQLAGNEICLFLLYSTMTFKKEWKAKSGVWRKITFERL